MHPLEMMKRMTADECREFGEIFIDFADRPRDATFNAMIDTVLAKFQDPAELSQVAVLQRARERVQALNDGLQSDGMDHQKLIADELSRRGDSRSVEGYCRAVCDGPGAHSDVLHGDIARD